MRTGKTTFFTAISIFLLFVASSYGADVAKIGIVDFQRILGVSKAGKLAQANISRQGKEMEADLKNKGNEIKELKDKIDREALVMSKETREEKEREFRIKLNDIKTLEKKYMTQLKTIEAKLVKQMQKDVFEIVNDIGKKEGYLLILNKVGVVYAPDTIDITDQVIQKYNIKVDQETKNAKDVVPE